MILSMVRSPPFSPWSRRGLRGRGLSSPWRDARISDLETAVQAIEENLGVTEHKARDAAEIHARKPTAKMERLVSLMHSLALVSAAECGVVAMAAAAAVLCLRLSDRSQV
ncbi:hypothetical protein OPV22_018724 [Ensete ventricosum]|uniref:Uncharacterized protein n=1 Tax=Ensete ventricosum TaxID=4639 RepID=A0AAV8R4X6_ENSVE|nr:hypothetical protein OPV22_018724 [Ensete ventricosum]